jgi:phosphonate transport system ATP-binding protein
VSRPAAAGPGARTAVALAGVTVSYGRTTALADVDLALAPGERVALLGPSGAGKSTLLGLLTGRAVPSAGSVRVFGVDVGHASERELRAVRRRVGTVAQQLDLVGPLRVLHNVNAGRLGSWSLGRAVRSLLRPVPDERALAALRRVGLEERALDRTDALSGGQQQRVAVARLLAGRPDLLLADEPVSSLDPGLAVEILRLLREAAADTGGTLLLSLHDPELARRFADRLGGLRGGRVVFDQPAHRVDATALDELYALDAA